MEEVETSSYFSNNHAQSFEQLSLDKIDRFLFSSAAIHGVVSFVDIQQYKPALRSE